VPGERHGRQRRDVSALVADPPIPVDFIAYHPYQKLGDQPTIADMEEYLGTVYSNQRGRWQDIRMRSSPADAIPTRSRWLPRK